MIEHNKVDIKICRYRNCKVDISCSRKNKLYCCRRHKEIESTYKKRNIKRVSSTI